MPIRVAHVGTGNVGRLALAGLIDSPPYELTGVCVSSPGKVGKDAGELAGLDISTSITAVGDLDDLLATEPEVVVYCAMGDTRLRDALEDCRRILAAGVDIVGTAPGLLQYPWQTLPDKYIAPIEEAARRGGSSIFITGIDPGFANDLLPFTLAGTCQIVERIRCTEIADYATYDGATVMFDVMGFGKPLDEVPMLLQPGVLSLAWGPAIRQLAAGLDVEIEKITEDYERIPAPEAFEIAAGHIPAGGLAALRFEIRGIVDGHPAIVAAAGRIVNAIPAVVAALPGIRTTLDLPLVTAPGRFLAAAPL
ncbi:diacylglycerol kinase [Nocardia tengchongensis]|uniref:NAD(P)H-dependent amine dehydrogenase family protein n=1 Tax=Nocardia tengchongensis TaxID=2055889 RepID=UPI0036124B4B